MLLPGQFHLPSPRASSGSFLPPSSPPATLGSLQQASHNQHPQLPAHGAALGGQGAVPASRTQHTGSLWAGRAPLSSSGSLQELPMPHLLPGEGSSSQQPPAQVTLSPEHSQGWHLHPTICFLPKCKALLPLGQPSFQGASKKSYREMNSQRFSSSNGRTCSAVSCSFTLSARGKRGAPLRTAVATELPSHCCGVRASHSLLTGRLTAPPHRPNGARGAHVPVISQ